MMERKIYQSPQIKILVLSGRKLMDDDWVIGGTVVDVQGAKGGFGFDSDEDEGESYRKHYNVWDY